MKSVHIWSFSGPYFTAFGANADQKNFNYGQFSPKVTDLLTDFKANISKYDEKSSRKIFRGENV